VLKRQVADAQSFDALAGVLQVAGLPVDTA
jgi:hypothetical protein